MPPPPPPGAGPQVRVEAEEKTEAPSVNEDEASAALIQVAGMLVQAHRSNPSRRLERAKNAIIEIVKSGDDIEVLLTVLAQQTAQSQSPEAMDIQRRNEAQRQREQSRQSLIERQQQQFLESQARQRVKQEQQAELTNRITAQVFNKLLSEIGGDPIDVEQSNTGEADGNE